MLKFTRIARDNGGYYRDHFYRITLEDGLIGNIYPIKNGWRFRPSLIADAMGLVSFECDTLNLLKSNIRILFMDCLRIKLGIVTSNL